MSKSCLVKGCDKDVAFSCDCTGNPIFMCTLHPSVHLLVKGNHQITGLLFKPNKGDVNDIKHDFIFASSKIKSLIDQTLKTTEKIIRKTLKASNKLIKYLEDVQLRFEKLFKKSLAYDEIDIQDFEMLKIVASEDIKNKFEIEDNVIEQLTSIYDIDLSASSAFLLYYANHLNQLQALDLKNESSQNITLVSENEGQIIHGNCINLFSTTCNIETDTYFLFCSNSANIIDFNKNTCKVVANSLICSNICGSVCKEGIIYVFSSDSNSSSYAIDLKKKSFNPITSISSNEINRSNPQSRFNDPFNSMECYSNPPLINGSACLVKNEIVLTGFNIDGLYNYNSIQNAYNKILDIQKNFYKYIFKDWILSSEGKLYGNSGKSLFNFKYYKNDVTVNFPLSTSFCAFKGFIYFMDKQLKLFRINPAIKKLEIISYAQSKNTTQISVGFQFFSKQENYSSIQKVMNRNPFC